MYPGEANGGQWYSTGSVPSSTGGQIIRITGYGTTSSPVDPSWNQAQKTHTGDLYRIFSTYLRYVPDTTGGNSGSPVIHQNTGEAIGIHTHGGCSSTGGSNKAHASTVLTSRRRLRLCLATVGPTTPAPTLTPTPVPTVAPTLSPTPAPNDPRQLQHQLRPQRRRRLQLRRLQLSHRLKLQLQPRLKLQPWLQQAHRLQLRPFATQAKTATAAPTIVHPKQMAPITAATVAVAICLTTADTLIVHVGHLRKRLCRPRHLPRLVRPQRPLLPRRQRRRDPAWETRPPVVLKVHSVAVAIARMVLARVTVGLERASSNPNSAMRTALTLALSKGSLRQACMLHSSSSEIQKKKIE